MDGFVMKRVNNLYRQISMGDMLRLYQKQVKVNTKNKHKIYKFEEYFTANITNVYHMFGNHNYKVSDYNIFLIRDPKYRIIMSQKMNDKIINHVMADYLIQVLDSCLINTNVATRKGKGTHYGMRYLKKYLNQLKGNTIYALKFDISKYFYNIDHVLLKQMLQKKIKDKEYLNILFKIIDSTNENVNERIMKIKKKEIKKLQMSTMHDRDKRIREIENIPLYQYGKGLPIGNMTSQIMAVFYLNDLDHYIKEQLHVKYYIRYMDDGVILSNDKKYLKDCLKKITDMVNQYQLTLNKKTCIMNVSKNGIDFLGFRYYIINQKVIMKVRNITKKRLRRKMKKLDYLYIQKKITKKDMNQVIASYQGHLKYGNTYFLRKKYLGNMEKKV